jgi:3-dehydroquinate synthetase
MYEFPAIEEKIRNDSAAVDGRFIDTPAENFHSYSLSLAVPAHHARASTIAESTFLVASLDNTALPERSYYMVDAGLQDTPIVGSLGNRAYFVKATEDSLKEISWLTNFVDTEIPPSPNSIVGIGGGILLNAAAFAAEKRGIDFVAVPTTVLAAADSAIGGLIRINKVEGGQFQKSFYKSVYEPSRIILDPKALLSLPKKQISFGLSEVVKHGAYQSTALLEYLAGDDFDPLNNQDSLLKAICWTAALKNVVIVHDPDSESAGGSILRGGHKLALSIEEESQFKISHGEAVAVGVYQDNLQSPEKIALLNAIYQKLELPKTRTDLAR